MADSIPTPKQIVRRYLKAMTHGKPGDLTKLIAPGIVAVQGAERVQGAAAAEAYSAHYRQAFKGWWVEVDRMNAEGSWVAVSGHSVVTVNTELPRAVKPGTAVRVPWMAHYRVLRGRVADRPSAGVVGLVELAVVVVPPQRLRRVPLGSCDSRR